MEYYTWVLIFRKHKAYVAGSKSPGLPYHRRGKTGFRERGRVQRGGCSRRSHTGAYNPSHCHASTETETSKITWPLSQLFEARPGTVRSLQTPEKISKRQHSIVSSSAQPPLLPFTSSWPIWSIMFLAYLRCSWKSKQSFRRKKGKLFCRWCHFSLSSPRFCCWCHSLWWKEKAQRTHLICCQPEDGSALTCSHSAPDLGDVPDSAAQADFYISPQPTVSEPRVGTTTRPAKTTVASFDKFTK